MGSLQKSAGGAPLDRRYVRSASTPKQGNVLVWDSARNAWVPQGSLPVVEGIGGILSPPVVQAGSTSFTANGSTQFFAVSWPVAFASINSAVFSLNSPISLVWSTLNAFTVSSMTVQVLTSGAGFIPNGTVIIINWVAVGM